MDKRVVLKINILILIVTFLFTTFLGCKEDELTRNTSEIRLATWNIRYLSHGSRDNNELAQIANILRRYDLIAIQEARDTEVLNRLKNILPGYNYIASPLVGTETQKELYTYFYKTSIISQIGTPYIYNDINNDFIREPYIACFKSGNFDFTIINIHVLWGTVTTRREEIKLLDEVLINVENNNGGEKDIILLGDFNFDRDDFGWQITTHKAIVSPSTKTKIEDTSSYDNIWINPDATVEYKDLHEVYRFDELVYDNDDDKAELEVSDHRPVAVIFKTNMQDDDTGTGCNVISYVPVSPAPEDPDVRIYSVIAQPIDSEQITLKNYLPFNTDISAWTSGDLNNTGACITHIGTVLGHDYLRTFPYSTLVFGINNSGEVIYLKNNKVETIDTWSN